MRGFPRTINFSPSWAKKNPSGHPAKMLNWVRFLAVDGQKVLVFAKKFNGSLSTTGWFQGKYRLHKTEKRAADSPEEAFVGGGKHLPIRKNTSLESLRLQVADIQKRARIQAKEGAEK